MRARPLTLVAAGGLGAAAAYAFPSLARLAPPRLRLTPGLSGLGRQGHVALTFDDGPDPRGTPAVARELDRLGWKATFFCLGSMLARSPGVARDLVDAGHELGLHGWDHTGALRRTPRAIADDLRRCQDALHTATGTTTRWYRPPYGELSLGSFRAAAETGTRVLLWTAWGRDWRAEATPMSVLADLRRGVIDGGTLLLHDSDCTSAAGSWRVTTAALRPLAEHLGALGLAVGPVSEHGLAA